MKKNIKKPKVEDKRKKYTLFMLFVLFVIVFLSIGYSALNSSVTIDANVQAVNYGKLFISSLDIADSSYVTESALPTFDEPTLTTSLAFGDNSLAYITYHVTVSNGSSNVEKYTGASFNVDSSISNIISYEVSGGLTENDYLLPGESTTFNLTYKYKTNASVGTYNLITQFNFTDCGSFFGYKTTTSADLTSNTTSLVNLMVVNSGSSAVNYTLSLDNSKFILVDEQGNTITSLTAAAKSKNNLNVYVKAASSAVFYKNSYNVNLTLASGSTNIDLGNLAIAVTPTYGYTDETMVSIGAISMSLTSTVGSLDVNWSRTDTGGSDVTDYVVKLYNTSDNLIATGETKSSSVTYRFTGISPGTYYAVVYGVDAADNSGTSYCSSATTSSTYCRKSANTEIRWARTVTYSLTNLTSNGASTANYGSSLSFTLTAASNYTLPTSITVTMGGTTLSSGTGYTYNSSSGAVTISKVTGDIVVTATGTSSWCLVSGTNILLADNTIKKIDDITYQDLLKVWSYDEGRFVGEYPIWIEKTKKVTSYQLTTFSDGTTLKTVGYHGVYSPDYNMFISVDNPNYYHPGTTILKEKNDEFYSVKIAKIETINEVVNYYHVVSTRYYNIIADNVLTTDGTTILSNLYGFTDKVTWPANRNYIMSDKNNLYTYEDLKSALPYYMYKGLRAEEAKYIINMGYLTTDKLIYYFQKNQTNPNMLLDPISRNGKRMWMVTTSDDVINETNKDNYLVAEGSDYLLPEPKYNSKEFIGWYNTSDNKIYYPEDKITIWYGTYLEALWK